MIQFRPPSPLPVGYQVSIRNLLGITFLTVLIFIVLGVIIVQLDQTIFDEARDRTEAMLWFALLLATSVLTATGYVLAWRTPLGWGIVGMTRPTRRWILIAVAVGVILFFVGERVDSALGLGILADFKREFGSGLESEVGVISLLAARVLLLPLALEVYFRGVLLNFFANRLGQEAGLFVSSILFAGLFFSPSIPISMAYGFIYGIAYGLLFLRSGSLWPAIVGHATLGGLVVAKAAWV